MIYSVIAYILAYFLINFIIAKSRWIFHSFPKLKFTKQGIEFVSFKKHRIKLNQCKYVQLNNLVYIKTTNQLIVIKNVDNLFERQDYLYFKALGKVKIVFDFKQEYKYFNLKLSSNKIDINDMWKKAGFDVVENITNLNNAEHYKKYINLLTRILNIEICDDGLKIRKNKFNIPFSVVYKLNGKIKRVNINETF